MPQETYTKEQFWSDLEALGEDKVLLAYKVEQRWGSPPGQRAVLVELWLKSKEDERALAASAKRDAREEETLSIAKEANRIASEAEFAARKQARYAMYAAIVAATAAIVSAKEDIWSLIAKFL